MSLRDDLLGFNDLRTKEVEVKQWKTTLTVRELGLSESMSAFSNLKPDEDGNVKLEPVEVAKVVAYGVIDPETGERVFSDDDVKALSKKSHKALMVLYTAITSLSTSVEDEVKN